MLFQHLLFFIHALLQMLNKLILMRQDMQNVTLIHCQTERFIKHLMERWWSKCIYIERVITKHRRLAWNLKILLSAIKVVLSVALWTFAKTCLGKISVSIRQWNYFTPTVVIKLNVNQVCFGRWGPSTWSAMWRDETGYSYTEETSHVTYSQLYCWNKLLTAYGEFR